MPASLLGQQYRQDDWRYEQEHNVIEETPHMMSYQQSAIRSQHSLMQS